MKTKSEALIEGPAEAVRARDSFLSSSWDDTVKLWRLDAPHSLRTFAEHTYCVYVSVWNPHHAEVFASVSGDCTAKVRWAGLGF